MRQVLVNVVAHLIGALRALLFLRVPQVVPGTGFGVVAAMVALAIAVGAGYERLLAGTGAEFDADGITSAITLWVLFAVLVMLLRRPSRPFAPASLMATCAALTIWSTLILIGATLLPHLPLDLPTSLYAEDETVRQADVWWNTFAVFWNLAVVALPWLIAIVWMLIAYWRIGRAATVGMPRRLGIALPVIALLPCVLVPSKPMFPNDETLVRTPTVWDLAEWLPIFSDAEAKTRRAQQKQQPPPPPPIDVEAAWERQPELVARALATLAPSRPGVPEVYFVGGALYGGQDVFKREITSARQIVDERLDAAGRSLLLINHRDTVEDLPLANATNLEKILVGLGRVMDRDKDTLVLFLTSHGSEGALAVSLSRFGFNDLTPERLASMLAKSGIRHRVVILSACHSGSFLPALSDADTLVLTAAHAKKTSFGCSNEREWTYFGDALFNHALRATTSLPEAFRQAAATVATWEKAQKLVPSEPQMHIGEAIAARLEAIEQRLAKERKDTQEAGAR